MYWFENDVNQYGTQAFREGVMDYKKFENDVNQYGTQAILASWKSVLQFENDVNQYGTQALFLLLQRHHRLRMM